MQGCSLCNVSHGRNKGFFKYWGRERKVLIIRNIQKRSFNWREIAVGTQAGRGRSGDWDLVEAETEPVNNQLINI